jgi:hypothetical protein
MTQDIDPSQRSYSWGEMADLTHATQVEIFGWCGCEDSENPYSDCPTKEVTEIEWEITIDKYAKEIGWEIGTSKERARAREKSNETRN